MLNSYFLLNIFQNAGYTIFSFLISGVICNGTAISPKSITVPSPNNQVSNSKLTDVSTNTIVPHVSKPSPTKSLQVTMKDFDLLKVLGTGGNCMLLISYSKYNGYLEQKIIGMDSNNKVFYLQHTAKFFWLASVLVLMLEPYLP